MNNFLIIGYGLIGKERLKSLIKIYSNKNFTCDVYDPNIDKNHEDFEISNKIKFLNNKNDLTKREYDLVIICTPHNLSKDYACLFLNKNIDILIEKPLGRNINEMREILGHQKKSKIHVGFNYEYFEAIKRLKSDLSEDKFGELISVEMSIGHGNSPNMDKSWKLDPNVSGGGVLLDPGIHMIDLLYFLFDSDIQIISVCSWDGFWNTGIEEEVKILLKINKTLVLLNISGVRWKSMFEISINGKDAYARISGRGRTYGDQVYYYGERWSWLNGKSQSDNEQLLSKSACENSFTDELKEIISGREANTSRAISGMELYEEIKCKIV